MTRLYVLAYPTLKEDDRNRIEDFRQVNDAPFRDVVSAHFTLVFGLETVSRDTMTSHVAEIADTTAPIPFTCRYAMLGLDDQDSARGYVFLVPDEGFSALSRLHDRLYSGLLATALRLDIPFIPHITVGACASLPAAKELCDAWNAKPFEISGVVERLTVAKLHDREVSDLKHLPLNGRV